MDWAENCKTKQETLIFLDLVCLILVFWRYLSLALKTKSYHDANFVVAGGTRGCHK